jgi:RNA-binding protein 5/10
MGASIDSTTVIIDRATGLSKRYGFAKFFSVEHARAFVEPNFPVVTWKERGGPSMDDGLKIKINYSQKTGGWRDDQGATARMVEYHRKATGTSKGWNASAKQRLMGSVAEAAVVPMMPIAMNDGTRDIGSSPTQILLLRNLDPLTSEEEIVHALTSLPGRAGNEIRENGMGGVKKIFLVKDRGTRQSWGFAFVQFADVRVSDASQ